MNKLRFILLCLLISACSKDQITDPIIDPEPPVDTVLGNYGSPFYSGINYTTGKSAINRTSAGRFISRLEAEERININNGASGTYILADQAQVLFDYDSDGDLDFFGWLTNITPCNGCGNIAGAGKWVWWPNYEQEGSTPTYYDSGIWWAARFEINDFNGDGIWDILWKNENEHNNGQGGFYTDQYPLVITYLSSNNITENFISQPTTAHDIATGDYDNDGDIDIIEAEWKYGDCGHISTPTFYTNDGFGNFTASKNNLVQSSTFQNNSCVDLIFTYLDLFDINGDGNLDVISAFGSNQDVPNFVEDLFNNNSYSPNHTKVWYGDGSGNFDLSDGFRITTTTPTQASIINCNATVLGGNFVDIDNDGLLDLVRVETYNYSGWGLKVLRNVNGEAFEDITSNYITNPVQLYSGASAPFAQQQVGDVGISYDIHIIDIDNDGDFDIMPSYPSLENNTATTKTAYFENNGGTYTFKKLDN